MKKKLLCFLGAAALALALSACSNNKSTSEAASEGASDVAQSSAATDTGAKKHMNTATFWFGSDLDPANGWNAWTLSRAAVGENLATVNDRMEIVHQLADDWELVDDTTWKFHIRQGVKFSNGKELTPEDVKKSIERAVAKDERAKSNAKLASMEVDGEYLIYKTTEPYASLVANLTEPLFCIIDTDQAEADIPNGPICTGPYKITSFTPDVEIQLAKNEYYWNGDVALDTYTLKDIEDDDTRLAALQSGELDMAQSISATGITILESAGGYTVTELPSPRVEYLCLNHKHEFLSDIHVRRAFSYAIDRDTLTSIKRGEAAGAVFPAIAGYNYDKLDLQKYNLEQAKKELAEAGFTDTDGDGILEKNGKKLSFTLPIPKASPVAEFIKEQLKVVGIDVEIQLLENINELREQQDFDLLLLNYVTATTGDPKRFLEQNYTTNGTDNFGHYSNPEFDKIVSELVSTFDANKRLELVTKAQQILNEDVANVFLLTTNNNTVSKANVDSVTVFPIDYYFMTKDVTIE